MKFFIPFILFFSFNPVFSTELTLKDCGNVIGHEMGLWEFFDIRPNPTQVDRVLKSKLNFVKISLRKLKDGVWVVNHDADLVIYLSPLERIKVNLRDLTWDQVLKLKSSTSSNIPIFRLEEYLQRDKGRLCWMLTPKDSPDINLVNIIQKLNISERVVFTTGNVSEVAFYSSLKKKINFAGRVGDNPNELIPYQPYLSQLWAMEVDPKPRAAQMIHKIHQLGLKAYLDSMRYSKTYELFGSVCNIVFAMGADITQTNRPQECIKKMGF